jgi:hypothetical protein
MRWTVIGLALLAAGCATAPATPQPPARQIFCKAGPDCEAKWSRAVSWVTTNSAYKIKIQTDQIIQTMGPSNSSPLPAYTVTKVATSGGAYEITFDGGCDNWIGCVPKIPAARAQFADFVLGP